MQYKINSTLDICVRFLRSGIIMRETGFGIENVDQNGNLCVEGLVPPQEVHDKTENCKGCSYQFELRENKGGVRKARNALYDEPRGL